MNTGYAIFDFFRRHPHSVFTGFCDVLLIAVCTFNLYNLWRTRKLLTRMRKDSAEMARFNRDKAPNLIAALDTMANVICPLCGVAAGEIHGVNQLTSTKIQAQPEKDGEHVVYDNGETHSLPCRAIQVRNDVRMLMNETMQGMEKQVAA